MALHILLGRLDGKYLILRLLKWKQFLELPLPYRIFSEGIALALLADRIQLHQILCHGADRAAHLGLGVLPFLAA